MCAFGGSDRPAGSPRAQGAGRSAASHPTWRQLRRQVSTQHVAGAVGPGREPLLRPLLPANKPADQGHVVHGGVGPGLTAWAAMHARWQDWGPNNGKGRATCRCLCLGSARLSCCCQHNHVSLPSQQWRLQRGGRGLTMGGPGPGAADHPGSQCALKTAAPWQEQEARVWHAPWQHGQRPQAGPDRVTWPSGQGRCGAGRRRSQLVSMIRAPLHARRPAPPVRGGQAVQQPVKVHVAVVIRLHRGWTSKGQSVCVCVCPRTRDKPREQDCRCWRNKRERS